MTEVSSVQAGLKVNPDGAGLIMRVRNDSCKDKVSISRRGIFCRCIIMCHRCKVENDPVELDGVDGFDIRRPIELTIDSNKNNLPN